MKAAACQRWVELLSSLAAKKTVRRLSDYKGGLSKDFGKS